MRDALRELAVKLENEGYYIFYDLGIGHVLCYDGEEVPDIELAKMIKNELVIDADEIPTAIEFVKENIVLREIG